MSDSDERDVRHGVLFGVKEFTGASIYFDHGETLHECVSCDYVGFSNGGVCPKCGRNGTYGPLLPRIDVSEWP